MENVFKDILSFRDSANMNGLRGEVQIYRKNKKTGEVSLWDEDHNIIPISGMQWILMKMFGLYLDSPHAINYEDLGKDTTLIIPDLNNADQLNIGIDPEEYETMGENISSNHFIQGFMVGNGGAGEDAITTKNTDYAFIRLRNPIPFQQTNSASLSPDISPMYLGEYRGTGAKSYYIKKFDETPHIYHSWWKDNQKWDYLDPITQNDLGPGQGIGKTNRIETYCQCKMTISEDDCIAYFSHQGNTATAELNELGLVSYDSVLGTRSQINQLYGSLIKRLINIVFNNKRTEDEVQECISLADIIYTSFERIDVGASTFIEVAQTVPRLNGFISTLTTIKDSDASTIDFDTIKEELRDEDTNIFVQTFYNRDDETADLLYTTDDFESLLTDSAFDNMTTDECQRTKLITYYTFKTIPLQSDSEIIIYYRIYAN